MSNIVQYTFFESPEESELRAIREACERDHDTLDRVRKSLYARDGKQDYRLTLLEERLAILEKAICSNT